MKAHTHFFKNQIKELGREIDSKITYDDKLISSEQLFNISPVTNSSLLKSVMKELEFESSIQVPINTIVNYEFGLKINDSYEYINFGNYVVYSCEYNEDTQTYNYICYDKMLFSMKEYINLQHGTFPMTVREYINNLCIDCGLEFENINDIFANYDKTIENDLYANLGYTYRDIFDELSQVTASNICISNENKVEIRYFNDTNDTIDEEYLKDINVKFCEKYGPINSIVLSRSAGSDSVYLQDETSVETNGLCEIKISDNQIMNFNDRSDYLDDILDKLNGIEYYVNDFASTGILYYEVCDKFNIKVGENTYNCILFNDEPKITQGIVENIYTNKPEETNTDYMHADKDDRKLNQVYIMAKKQEGEIEALVSKTETIDTTINNNYQELTEKFDGYTPINKTVEIENSVTQLQTDTYTKTEINTKLKDGSVEMVKTTLVTVDHNGTTWDKSDSKVKSNADAVGFKIIDKTGAEGKTILDAGYDAETGETRVLVDRIKVNSIKVGSYSQIEDFIDEKGREGLGIFV